MPSKEHLSAPWYKHLWPWLLLSGPVIVILAAFYTFYLAQTNADDMVSDDYYKEGKYINLQLERDIEASKRRIQADILFNEEHTAAKVFLSGDFDPKREIRLALIHPVKKEYDQIVALTPATNPSSGDKAEYSATFAALPNAVHWYVRVEDDDGKWRVQEKWLPKQSAALALKAQEHALMPKPESSGS